MSINLLADHTSETLKKKMKKKKKKKFKISQQFQFPTTRNVEIFTPHYLRRGPRKNF